MSWTQFMDMHSGGGTKTDYEYIYIEADEESATNVFGHLFDEHPNSVACQCCGSNFSMTCSDTLEEATEYQRCWGKKPLEEYLQDSTIKVISDVGHAKDGRFFRSWCRAGELAAESVKEAGQYYKLNVELTAGYVIGSGWDNCH